MRRVYMVLDIERALVTGASFLKKKASETRVSALPRRRRLLFQQSADPLLKSVNDSVTAKRVYSKPVLSVCRRLPGERASTP